MAPPPFRTFIPSGGSATKSAAEVLDYGFDWANELSSEAVVSSTWVADDGSLALSDASLEGSVASVWTTGGTFGAVCRLTNTVSTGGGRVLVASLDLLVVA